MSSYTPSVVLLGQVALLVLEELNCDPAQSQRFSSKHIKEKLSKKMQSGNIKFKDEDYAFGRIESTGQERWFAFVYFAVSFLKYAGYKTGPRGFWEITNEGQDFLKTGQDRESIEEELYQLVSEYHRQYGLSRKTKSRKNKVEIDSEIDEKIETEFIEASFNEDDVGNSIYRHLEEMSWKNFQNLVGFLFEGMGYVVSYNSKKGRDGGIDIVAHTAPIGLGSGIVKIQVKHTGNIEETRGIGMDKISELRGLCAKDHSVPVFVSLQGFTEDAYKRSATDSGDFVTLIDCVRFVDLWIEYIETIPEEGKRLFPLKKVYVIDSE